MATIEEGRLCKEDGDCSEKQYCYDVSGRCVDYTLCNRYNRQESQKYSRHPSQCGPCLPGYSAEVLGTGDMALLCKKNSAPQIGTDSTKLNGTVIISITLGAIVCVVVAAIAIFMFLRRQSGGHENNRQKWSQVCIAGPTAPPPESSPFIGYGELTTSMSYNNNQNVKDKNMLVNASPFKDPNWIRSNPNYEHRLSNNDLNNSEESHSSVQLPLEIDSNTTSWTPEQLTIQVANGALSEYGTEHRENTMNAVLVQRNYPSGSTTQNNSNNNSDDRNNDDTSGTNNTHDNHNRGRASNVLITQKITMNLNVLNGD